MKTLVPLILLLCSTAHAQPAVLLEACNNVQDSGKRLECLKAAVGVAPSAPSQSSSSAATEQIERAFSGINSSIEIGVSWVNYQTALLDLARVVAVQKALLPSDSSAAQALIDNAVEAYKDAGTLWEASIRFYARRGNDTAYFGGLPVEMVGLGWIVGKYNLTTRNADLLGLNVGVPTNSGRSEIWRRGRQLSSQAISMLKNPQPSPPVAATVETSSTEEEKIVEDFARRQACNASPVAARTVSKPDFSDYYVYCTSGKALEMRCRAGACIVID